MPRLEDLVTDLEFVRRNGASLSGLSVQEMAQALATDMATELSGTFGTVVNVAGYGAVGDGVADDTAEIAAALAVVNASGGVLYFPAGKTYKITDSVNITHDDVTVWGYESTLDIQKDGTATGRSLKATSADRVKFLGLRLACSNEAARNQVYGILSLFSCTDFTIRDVVITGGEGIGIYTELCQRGAIAGCRVSGTRADGIHLSRKTLDVSVVGCQVDAVEDDGIVVASVTDDGVPTYDPCARITISDCTVRDLVTLGAGIAVNGGDDIAVTNCVVQNPISHGLQVDGGLADFHPANRVNFSNCHAVGVPDAKYGFNIANASDTVVTGCTARSGVLQPVVIANSDRTLISGCTFLSAAGIAIYDDANSSETYVVGCYLQGSGTQTALNGSGSIAVTRQPQPLDTDLTAIAALTSAADKAPYATGAGTWALATLTSFARTLLDDADAATARTTLAAAPLLGTVGGPPLIVWKSADETVNNSAVMQDDNHLILPVGANEKWVGEFYLFVAGDATADFRFNLTVPAGASGRRSAAHPRTTDTLWQSYQAPSITTQHNDIGNQAAGMLVMIPFYLATAGTAGNLTLQWCQNVATVADTTVMLGSYLKAWRIA